MTPGLPLPPAARLRVTLDEGRADPAADGGPLLLGAMVATPDRRVAWEWSQAAIAAGDDAGINLATRQVPFVAGVHIVGTATLDGLPGLLYDSLPDAWGRLLTDRALRRRGIQPHTLRGFDRLAIVGSRGPGALCFAPEFPVSDMEVAEIDLDSLATEAALTLAGEQAGPDALERLERLGGSAGGSRPKAWIAMDTEGRIRPGAEGLFPGETGWLVKFRAPRDDPKDIGRLEYAYARMAQHAGLDVAEPRLFETRRGAYFASLRFDRKDSGRVHVASAAGLMNVPAHGTMAVDYVDLLRLTRIVTRSEAEVMSAFRHAVFNAMAHNRDDHLRQFVFLRRKGVWVRAPAFDLTFSDGPGGEHTLLVAGEGRRPGRHHLETLGKGAGLKAAAIGGIIDEVRAAVVRWKGFADESGVSASSRRRVATALDAWT